MASINRCIFCKTSDGPFGTREHILPESLGGGDWAILPPGLFCDSCQNRFGSSIEQQALDDYPFSMLRVFLGIPTKKGKAAWLKSWEGIVRGSPTFGQIGYDPAPNFEAAALDGRKTQMRILAEPRRPEFVCRTLLKMGLEVVAADHPDDALSQRFDDARNYALYGVKHSIWWYLHTENFQTLNRILTGTPVSGDFETRLEVITIDDDAEVFHMRLFYLDVFCPLESRTLPPCMKEIGNRHNRLFML